MMLILYCCLVMMSSCIYTAMSHLSKDDLTWIKVYDMGDTLLFHSGVMYDTLIVNEVNVYNSYNPFHVSEATDEYKASAEILYCIIHEGETMDGFFHISKPVHSEKLVFSICLSDRYAFDITPNLHEYESVEDIHVDDGNSRIGGNQEDKIHIEQLTWSKTSGLREYVVKDGDSLHSYTQVKP